MEFVLILNHAINAKLVLLIHLSVYPANKDSFLYKKMVYAYKIQKMMIATKTSNMKLTMGTVLHAVIPALIANLHLIIVQNVIKMRL